MANLQILHFPDPRLHLKAVKVEEFDESIRTLVNDMAQTMYANNGIGLAATQVNVQKRLFIIDMSREDQPKNLLVFVNPEIINKSGEIIGEEGCLSVPGIFEKVIRSEIIKLKFQDMDGVEHIIDCDGLMSVCIQHEIDHLDGKVFVEYLSNLKQNYIKRKMKKIFKPE
ncbi:MAG TPA: peptide deformylase [Burkholderiales bacterium]|nr:peptide deformylase [Burkholderiales bacterium]